MAKAKKDKAMYGIGEWYGRLFSGLSDTDRHLMVDAKRTSQQCPYYHQVPDLAPKAGMHCSKDGGVCSLRNFVERDGGVDLGPITATCPSRFLENGTIIKEIGKVVLGTNNPVAAKEIPFLKRVSAVNDPNNVVSDREDVGSIDLVLVDPDAEPLSWCAVELQAVYFSGGAMSDDFKAIRAHSGNSLPMPAKARRPDFRSSGPKRLMPQLQIKVPTLRRWGKKMVVVVDRPFMDAMGPMEPVDHISNCDIIWLVVRFDIDPANANAKLVVDELVQTTLEASVIGLTAGSPTNLPDFEAKIRKKIGLGLTKQP